MTPQGFEQALKAYAKRTPFKPFEVELVSGSTIRVDHQEAVFYRGRAAVYIDPQGDYTLFDNESVAQLKDIPAASRKRSARAE